jgi:hypothetical protein
VSGRVHNAQKAFYARTVGTYRVTWAFGLRSYVYWPFGLLQVTAEGLHFDRRYSSGRPGIEVPQSTVEAVVVNWFWRWPDFRVYTFNRKRPVIVRPLPLASIQARLLSDLRSCGYPVEERWNPFFRFKRRHR